VNRWLKQLGEAVGMAIGSVLAAIGIVVLILAIIDR
jgi:hypothetical protein